MKKENSQFVKYIEPAIIVTVLTVAMYWLGWSYVEGFCGRIGINHDSLDLPTVFYLREAMWGVLIGVPILIFSLTEVEKSSQSVMHSFKGNLVVFFL